MGIRSTASRPKVYIKTFGCQMNEYDSLRILRLLESCGYERALSYEEATVILLNTCSVRRKAEDKVYSELGRIKKLKNRQSNFILGVGGCVAQQEGHNLVKRFPYIDIVFGTHCLSRLPVLIEKAFCGDKAVDVSMPAHSDIYPSDSYMPHSSQISAFISIMHGCDNYCSYCVVPFVRGREYSRDPDDILREVTNLVDAGIKEITLLGQNVNSYGRTVSPSLTFAALLRQLNVITGLERIRFTTSHPKDLSDQLIDCFAELDKLCGHIHLPLQSGSDRILDLMNRGYTSKEYRHKIHLLRQAVPDISITSDILVGFPGETNDDFRETLALIESIGYDDLFMFHYTDRPGTKASQYTAKVPYAVKIKRLSMIKEKQRNISLQKNMQLIGKTCSVLFEGHSKRGRGCIAGRTAGNKVVNCKGQPERIGTTAVVKIEKARIHSLSGKLI